MDVPLKDLSLGEFRGSSEAPRESDESPDASGPSRPSQEESPIMVEPPSPASPGVDPFMSKSKKKRNKKKEK